MGRYLFGQLFAYNIGGLIYPRYRISVNNTIFEVNQPIPPGLTFGGINLYSYIGKDVAATWYPASQQIIFGGFYG